MNSSARFILLLLVACASLSVSAQKVTCNICAGDASKKVNPTLTVTHTIGFNWLNGRMEWTCTDLEKAAKNKEFDEGQCNYAKDISLRSCECVPLNWAPTVQQTPPCHFCAAGDTVPNPDKEVDTGIIGTVDCGTLVNGGKDGWWPEATCTILAGADIKNKCCSSGIAPAPPAGGGLFGCFSGENMVEVQHKGLTRMEDVEIGDMLLSTGKFSRVYSFGHRDTETTTDYVSIHSDKLAAPLELTKEHMVFVDEVGAVPAAMVSVGDKLVLADAGTTVVSKISTVSRVGAYAPFTESGTLIVNDVLSSSFISVKDNASSLTIGGVEVASLHWLAHTFEAPHRMVCKLSPSRCTSETYTEQGISHWVDMPFKASRWLMNQSAVVQGVLSVGVFLVCATFYVLESTLNMCGIPTLLVIMFVYANKRKETMSSKC